MLGESKRTFGRSASFKGDDEMMNADNSSDNNATAYLTSGGSKEHDPGSSFKSAKKLLFSKPLGEEDTSPYNPNSISPFNTSAYFPGKKSFGCTTVDEVMTEDECDSLRGPGDDAFANLNNSNLFSSKALDQLRLSNLTIGPLQKQFSFGGADS